MATYNALYVSTAMPGSMVPDSLPNSYTLGNLNSGTSSAISGTSQDLFEFTIVTGATYQITKFDALLALKDFERWLLKQPVNLIGTSGGTVNPDETGAGLDGLINYLVEDGNTVAAVP